MSLEVWGDEGTIPGKWDDTAMRQEFDLIRNRYNRWIMDFKHEAGSPELEKLIERAEDALDALATFMDGRL